MEYIVTIKLSNIGKHTLEMYSKDIRLGSEVDLHAYWE